MKAIEKNLVSWDRAVSRGGALLTNAALVRCRLYALFGLSTCKAKKSG